MLNISENKFKFSETQEKSVVAENKMRIPRLSHRIGLDGFVRWNEHLDKQHRNMKKHSQFV
jgi:hypothetical protein